VVIELADRTVDDRLALGSPLDGCMLNTLFGRLGLSCSH
jgi:hypothetical protein